MFARPGAAIRTALASLLVLASGPATLAKYNHFRFDLVNVELYWGCGFPAPFQPTMTDTFFQVEGFHRHNVFDMYWFMDFPDITNSASNDTHFADCHFYTELQPRISLDGLLGRDLAFWPFKEWYLSYELDMNDDEYGGGLIYHNIGIGTDLAFKGFYYFRGNLFARYIQNDYGNPSEGHVDGFLLNFSWGRKLCDLPHRFCLETTGWMDTIFLAERSKLKPDGTSYSYQGSCQLVLRRGRWGASAAFRYSLAFAQTRDKPDTAANSFGWIFGLICTFQK